MNRIEWIDTLRGFCIFCIVLGHTLAYMGLGGYNSTLGAIIVTFWLPLFFFISGFFSLKQFTNISDSFKRIKTKFVQLIVPAIIFVNIYSATFKSSPFTWIHEGFGCYWFTIVLFCYVVLNQFLLPLNNGRFNKIYDIVLITVSLLGIVILLKLRNYSWGWNFFCLENATKYFQFYALGLLSYKYRNSFYVMLSNEKFRVLVFILLSVSMLIYFGDSFENIPCIIFKINRDIVIRYVSLMTLLLYFSKNSMERGIIMPFFNRIGKITLDIYLLHWFFLPRLDINGNPLLAPFIVQLVISSALAFIIVKVCEIISSTIRISSVLSKYALGARNKIIE